MQFFCGHWNIRSVCQYCAWEKAKDKKWERLTAKSN